MVGRRRHDTRPEHGVQIIRIAALALAVGLVVAATTPSRAADPVLAQATDLAGLVMFLEFGAPIAT